MPEHHVLDEVESKELLATLGVATPARWVVGTEDVPPAGFKGRGPFALKILSSELVHKSDAGGVLLDVEASALADGIDRLKLVAHGHDLTGARVLVEEMVTGGAEIIVGAYVDPSFGPSVMVGFGGIFTEIFRDVTFGLCPIDRDDAREMIHSLRSFPLLDGARGRERLDVEGIVDVLMALGGADGLLMRDPSVVEVDINPLIVSVDRCVAVDAMVRRESGAAVASDGPSPLGADVLERILRPGAVAVVGASGSGGAPGNVFLSNIREQGFAGRVFPVHPKHHSIDGLPTVPSLADLPESVDYAFVAVNAERVPSVLESGAGKVAVAQVMSSGFRETSSGGELEQRLVQTARAVGTRVIGPNCLGIYSPSGGMTFVTRAPKETGSVALISQSGGIGADIVHRASAMGTRFSGAVTIGNGADLGAAEFLAAFLEHDETRVVGMYVEDGAQGRRLFDVLRAAPVRKPVVMLRGGRTDAGKATAAGHTGSMAGADHGWEALARQTGAVTVDSLSELVDTLRLFELCAARDGAVPCEGTVLIGNGGGVSVLGADSIESSGLRIHEFSAATRAAMDAVEIPPGMSVQNPIDAPAGAFELKGGAILEAVFAALEREAAQVVLVPHMNLPVIRDNLVDPDAAVERFVAACGRIATTSGSAMPPLLVLRSDGSPESDGFRRQVVERAAQFAIPTYRDIAEAATAGRYVRTWLEAAVREDAHV